LVLEKVVGGSRVPAVGGAAAEIDEGLVELLAGGVKLEDGLVGGPGGVAGEDLDLAAGVDEAARDADFAALAVNFEGARRGCFRGDSRPGDSGAEAGDDREAQREPAGGQQGGDVLHRGRSLSSGDDGVFGR
jgi:hypothetical protein